MKLSIVIPLFNKEDYVAETLQSVVDQTMLPHELIIVDDKSTDNSLQVAKDFIDHTPDSFKKAVRIAFIESERNRGIGYTRNAGFAQTTGDYVCFLDADDLYVPTLVERTSQLISSASLDFVVFGLEMFPSGKILPNMSKLTEHLTLIDNEAYRLDHPMKTVTIRAFIMGLGSNVIAKRSDMEHVKVYEGGKLGEGTDYWYQVMKIAYQRDYKCIGLLLGGYIQVREVDGSASRKKYDHWKDIDYPPTLIRYEKSTYLYDKLMMDVMGRRWLEHHGGALKTRTQRIIFKFNYRKLYWKHLNYWILRKIHANRPPDHSSKP